MRTMLTLMLVFSMTAPAMADDFRVLVFSKTSGFRHGSISDGIALVQQLGTDNQFAVDTTENAADFNASNLSQYAVVIWLSTTGNVLDAAQQTAFETYLQGGGAYVGVHAAADCEYGWPWYGQLLGADAWFNNHPSIQDATLLREDDVHSSSRHLPASFTLRDEWYNFQNQPTGDPDVTVVLTIDETSYSGGNMGSFHPMAWYHEYDGGRMWYTALGHRSEIYSEPLFEQHLLGGILWAAGCAAEDLAWLAVCSTGPDMATGGSSTCQCADVDGDLDVDMDDLIARQRGY